MQAARGDFAIFENTFFKIWITHLATQQTIDFRGWVTEFSDQFTSNWNKENVYGRMDPLATFQNTERQISIGFDVVSADLAQAQHNLNNINNLISFLYPVYKEGPRTAQNTLRAAPLLGMRWTNLIADPYDGSQLIGFLAGANYAPDLNQGSFLQTGTFLEQGTPTEATSGNPSVRIDRSGAEGIMIPKVVNMSLQYTVLHKHLTGWTQDIGPSRPGDSNFTFGGNNKLFPNASNVSIPGRTSNINTTFDTSGGSAQADPIERSAIADITGNTDGN